MKVEAIVQARMGSTRLPGKVLKDVVAKPMLWHVFNRLKYSEEIDNSILAISTSQKDDSLANFAKDMDIEFFRGSEKDVLKRYYNAAREFESDIIVRITGDCPLIDPQVTDRTIRRHLSSKPDFTSNTRLKRTYPRGLDTEVFDYNVLKKTHFQADKPYEREHVTPYIYENPDKFDLELVKASDSLKRPELRLTVDYKEDLKLIRKIFSELYEPNGIFYTEDVIELLDRKPAISKINAELEQKDLKE